MTAPDGAQARREPLPLRVIDAVTQGLNVLGSCLIVALMVLVGIDVAGRDLFGAPVAGVPEIVTLSIVAIVFLQIPQALKVGRMTRSEAVSALLAERAPQVGRALDTVFDLLGIAVVAVIVNTTWPLFVQAWDRNDFIGAIGEFTAPTWPVKLTIVVGGSVLILQFGLRIFRRYALPT
jgi:TRAP-type mannitol/chloroaromatic compound transport system permease small subunit